MAEVPPAWLWASRSLRRTRSSLTPSVRVFLILPVRKNVQSIAAETVAMLASSHRLTYNLLSTSAGLNITFGENREMSAGKVFALIWENVQLRNCCLITCVWGATLVFCAHSSGFSVCLWLFFHCLLHVTSFPSPLLLLDKQWNMEDDLLYLSFIFSHPGLVFLKSPMTLLLSATRDHKQQSNKQLIYSSPNPDQPRFSVEALSFPFYCKYTSACSQSLLL